jgi:hypothetical protein
MYKLLKSRIDNSDIGAVRDNGDGTSTNFPFDPANTDYQEYLKWLDEGNTPLPADE